MNNNKFKKKITLVAASLLLSLAASNNLAAKQPDFFGNSDFFAKSATFSVEISIEESCRISSGAQSEGPKIPTHERSIEKNESAPAEIKISCAIGKTAGFIQTIKPTGHGAPSFDGSSHHKHKHGARRNLVAEQGEEGVEMEQTQGSFSIVYF